MDGSGSGFDSRPLHSTQHNGTSRGWGSRSRIEAEGNRGDEQHERHWQKNNLGTRCAAGARGARVQGLPVRVNVDSSILGDVRLKMLARALKIRPHQRALGPLVAVWHAATVKKTEILAAEEVDAASEEDGMAFAMVRVGLAEDLGDGSIRVRGILKRLDYLLEQRERGKRGAASRWNGERHSEGDGQRHDERHQPANGGGQWPTSGSGSSPDLSPELTERRAAAPHEPLRLFPVPESTATATRPPAPTRKLKPAQVALHVHRDAAARLWELQDELRMAVIPRARRLSCTDLDLQPIADLLAAGRTVQDCEHALLARAGAVRDGEDGKYFNGVTNWRPENFRFALGMPVRYSREELLAGAAKKAEGRWAPDGLTHAQDSIDELRRRAAEPTGGGG